MFPLRNYRYNTALIIGENDIDNFVSSRILDMAFIAEAIVIKKNVLAADHYIERLQKVGKALPELIVLDRGNHGAHDDKLLAWCEKLYNRKGNTCRVVVLSIQHERKHEILKFPFVKAYLKKPLTVEAINKVDWEGEVTAQATL